MAQHKSIHYSSVDTQGKKSVSSFWISQTKSDFASAWQRSQRWSAWSVISSIFDQQRHSLCPGFSPVCPCPSSPTPYYGPRKCSRPGMHCPRCTWACLTVKRAGRHPFCKAVTLTSFCSPLGELSSMNKSGCTAESCGLGGMNLLLGLFPAGWFLVSFIVQFYKSWCQHK